MSTHRGSLRKAFTLIELLVVIAIIGVLIQGERIKIHNPLTTKNLRKP